VESGAGGALRERRGGGGFGHRDVDEGSARRPQAGQDGSQLRRRASPHRPAVQGHDLRKKKKEEEGTRTQKQARANTMPTERTA
jgi:hypothetical protein